MHMPPQRDVSSLWAEWRVMAAPWAHIVLGLARIVVGRSFSRKEMFPNGAEKMLFWKTSSVSSFKKRKLLFSTPEVHCIKMGSCSPQWSCTYLALYPAICSHRKDMKKPLINGKLEMLSVQLISHTQPFSFSEDGIENNWFQQKNSPHKCFSSKTFLTQNKTFTCWS